MVRAPSGKRHDRTMGTAATVRMLMTSGSRIHYVASTNALGIVGWLITLAVIYMAYVVLVNAVFLNNISEPFHYSHFI